MMGYWMLCIFIVTFFCHYRELLFNFANFIKYMSSLAEKINICEMFWILQNSPADVLTNVIIHG